jgi:hypothetical protein
MRTVMRTPTTLCVAAALVVVFLCRVGAADSFDGWWRLDERASTGVPPMMHGHDTVVHLTQAGNRFTIEFVFDGQSMNASDFVLDGQTHPGQLGATQEARWAQRPRVIEIDIHRPAGATMPGGDEHLIWELESGGQAIKRTSTRADSKAPPQIYVYRRMANPPGGGRGAVPPRV